MSHSRSVFTRGAGRVCLFLGAVSAALMTGCVGARPSLTVREAYVYSQSAEATVVHVVVDAENTSGASLPLMRADYSSRVGGATFKGSQDAKVAVGAQSVERFELPVVLPPGVKGEVSLEGDVTFVPQNKLRELLAELFPLPTVALRGTVTIDPATRAALPDRGGTLVRSAERISAPARPAADTLPPLTPR